MAAVLTPRPTSAPQTRGQHRAPLTLIEGGRSAAGLRKRRMYRQRRVVAGVTFLLASWLVLSLLWSGASALVGGSSPAPSPQTGGGAAASRYVVRGGDTLWSVSKALHIDGDIRDVMAELAEQNGDGVLRPGQVLVIPADLRS